MALLYEGIDPKRIEDLSREAGYPIGPLAILDEINISLAAKIRKTLRTGSTLVDKPWDIVMKIMIKKLQRTGRSSNGGFYEYPKGKKDFMARNKQIFPIIYKSIIR